MRSRRTATAVILLTLALGIGANVAIFSLVDGILFQPLSYPAPQQLVTQLNGYFPPGYVAGLAVKDRTAEIAGYSPASNVTLTLSGQPVQVAASEVTANFFNVLATPPRRGQGFAAGSDAPGEDGVAIISDQLWRDRFGARADAVGQVVRLDGRDRRIIGIMPPGFDMPSSATRAWVPVRMDPSQARDYWMNYSLNLVGRMHPGVSLSQARADLVPQAAAVASEFPYPIPKTWGTLYPLVALQTAQVGNLETTFALLLGAVGLVLLIACVNVVNLLLIQVTARRRELAIRLALGAGRGRIQRQILGETMRLALIGGGLGLLVAFWTVPLLVHALPAATPHLDAAGLHARVYGFALALTLLTGLVSGWLPGWRAAAAHLDAAMRSDGSAAGVAPARQRISALLLVAEVAIAVIVIVGGMLTAASLIKLGQVNPGFDAAGVTTLDVAPSDAFCAVAGRCSSFYQQLQSAVAALPGVESAAFVNALPLGGSAPIAPVIFEDHPLLPGVQIPLVWANLVTPGYLRTLGIRLLAGRAFTPADGTSGQKVVLLNAALARSLWPSANPIGKTLNTVQGQFDTWTVVGVVADVREMSVSGDPGFVRGEAYFPYAQALATPPLQGSLAPMSLVVRAAVAPTAIALRQRIVALDSDIPPTEARSLDQLVYANLAAPRATTGLFLLFALLALALSAIGVYGVMWHNVAQRTREFGVRMALGADRARVLWLVLARGLGLAGIGIVVGLAAAWGLTRLLHQLLFEISPTDPAAFALAAMVVALVALFACLWPARRATRVDPLVALRED